MSDALAKADLIIDARAGRAFDDSATERVVEDVRGDLVPLHGAFSDVTGVNVDGYALASTAYRVTSHGIRLQGYDTWGLGRGATVTVTATFGAEVPDAIHHAAILIAVDLLTGDDDSDSPLPDLGPDIKSLSVEGLAVTLRDARKAGEIPISGKSLADTFIDSATGTRGGIV